MMPEKVIGVVAVILMCWAFIGTFVDDHHETKARRARAAKRRRIKVKARD